MDLNPAEQDLAVALEEIVARHGLMNDEPGHIHPAYDPPENNPEAAIGVSCANCFFFEAPNTCAIVEAFVEPMGKCRFAVIPDGVVGRTGTTLAARRLRSPQ